MKVLFFLLGTKSIASSRVRGHWLAEELEMRGFRCTLQTGSNWLAYMRAAVAVLTHDCLVLQKRYGRWDLLLVRWAGALGRVTILDIDDKYSATDHPVTLKNIVGIMRRVSAVTAGSHELASFARKSSKRVALLPSAIRLEAYTEKSHETGSNPVTLGWIGNGRHYAQDLLMVLREPLARMARARSIRLKIVGACGAPELYEGFAGIDGLEVVIIDQVDWSDGKAVDQSMNDIDIGLYPLRDSDFNRHKCGFKAMEYMAKGIPVVASPVGAISSVIADGVDGTLAATAEDWQRALLGLVDDRSKRVAMGSAGRSKIETSFSMTVMADRFLALLNEVRERGQPKAP